MVGNNKIISKSDKNRNVLRTEEYTSSICSVPFIWDYLGTKYDMNFYAGFSGFKNENNAIRPVKNYFIGYN